MKKILIIGATSAIASETAKLFARDGAALFLVGRNAEKLRILANDLKIRGAHQVETLAADLHDLVGHATMVEKAIATLTGLDIALIAHGTLPNQKQCERDFSVAMKEFTTNFTSAASILTILANHFEHQRSGTLAAISSVAGDRGRPSNYIYGSAKGALSLFLEGLRARLCKSGVFVVTIKPGFVATPMTAGIKKNFLFTSPEVVGEGIYQAILKRRDTIYLPWWWRCVMRGVKSIPECIFKKMSL